ncbi:MAG: right-handed parallel beta-helix repeat-containing protein [Candidatus Thermoplasmatota archaeon]|nr:right-handed parallel beta-helix repeat-containing protein [Candidatus Thermoplasmatota archaeon]
MIKDERKRSGTALICSLLIFSSLGLAFIAFDGDGGRPGTRSTTLFVGNGQTYTTIQSAVDNASSGDTVRVFDGDYSEYVVINKTVSLIGNGTARSNIIKDNNLPAGIYLNYPEFTENVTISGFSFVKKDGSTDHIWIEAITANRLHIWNCEFLNSNTSISISSSSSDCRINDTYIEGTLDGAGIDVQSFDAIQIYDNTITNCTYGVWIKPNSHLSTVLRNNIYENIHGIEFYALCNGNWIENNTVVYNTYSITMNNGCRYNQINNNFILNNTYGIILKNRTSNNTIGWNTIKGQSSFGINIDGDWWDRGCFDNNIFDNEIKENNIGIYLNYSDRTTIEKCVIKDNGYGIAGTFTDKNIIHNNTIEGSGTGIDFDHGWETSIKYNLLKNNIGKAINLYSGFSGSYLFRICNNSFINNNGANSTFNSSHTQVISGYIVDLPNFWDDGIGHGNYWSDWTTPDNDSDGVVDDPYPILASFVNDNYPLTNSPFNTSYAPRINTINSRSAYPGVYYRVQYSAIDLDTPREDLEWSMETNATWLSWSASGLLQGTPLPADIGTYWVNVSVTDGNNSDFTNFTLEVYSLNRAPVITTIDVTTCLEDQLYSVDYDAVDNDILNWALVTDATFLRIDSYTGVLSGIPANSDVGTHCVKIRVDDGSLYVETVFDLTVINTNDSPSITTSDLKDGYRNANYYVDYNASDIDPTNDTLSWAFSTNAPFLSINSSLGILSGTPNSNQTGLYWVNVTVSDGNGGLDFSNFTLTMHYNNSAPSSTGVPQTLNFDEDSEDDSTDLDSLFGDTDGDPLSYSVECGENLTATIMEDNRLVIVPRENWAGTDHIRIFAFDGEYTTFVLLTVVIDNINDQPSIMDITFEAEFMEGREMVFVAFADDPDLPYGDELTFEWFIEGMGLVGTGHELVIDLDAGHYVLKLVVMDSDGIKVEKEVSFDVAEGSDGDAWWVPLLIVIIALLIMMMAAFGIFYLQRRRREVPETSEFMETTNISRQSSIGLPSDGTELHAEPMFENDEGYYRPVKGGDLDTKGDPEMKDIFCIRGDVSFLDSIEKDDDPLIMSAYDEILLHRDARDRSHIRGLRKALRKRIIEEEEDEEVYDELNEILEAAEE